jgi:PhoD-like phosphatase
MPKLVLGPLLRYVGETQATVWVETDAAAEVEVVAAPAGPEAEAGGGARGAARTFAVAGHHYALVLVEGLAPARTYTYRVTLDGEPAWPVPGLGAQGFPPSTIRTPNGDHRLRIAFGSCRLAAPHEPPWTLPPSADRRRGKGADALHTFALRMGQADPATWPDLLLLLGDQIYADDTPERVQAFIRARRDPGVPPGLEVADFEEYTRLYWEAWGDPVLRWLLSTVPTAMIFDDHDISDDWNTSAAWVEHMRRQPWWEERICSGLASYWLYQHLGNLSPADLEDDPVWPRVRDAGDATGLLREFAHRADREVAGTRWSYKRDFGPTRLVVIDSRCGRVLEPGRRAMVDEEEWAWIEAQAAGDFDHLLLATSLPFALAPAIHHLEAWNEAVTDGAWGRLAARAGERIRQAIDLEHWAAFGRSFDRLAGLIEAVAAGRRGRAPGSVVVLSGDVHHTYLAELSFPGGHAGQGHSPAWQVVCSPLRNPLPRDQRAAHRRAFRRPARAVTRWLARRAGVAPAPVGWRVVEGPRFDNHLGELELDGRAAALRVERAVTPTDGQGPPRLEPLYARHLADGGSGGRKPSPPVDEGS